MEISISALLLTNIHGTLLTNIVVENMKQCFFFARNCFTGFDTKYLCISHSESPSKQQIEFGWCNTCYRVRGASEESCYAISQGFFRLLSQPLLEILVRDNGLW